MLQIITTYQITGPLRSQRLGLCVYANNLDGGVMQMDRLRVVEFTFNVETDINEILNAPNDASVGYFLDVDLNYLVHLHDDHRDFPLVPTKEAVQYD